MATLITPRLSLGRFAPEDLAPFAAMNADPEVMRFFPGTWTLEQSRDVAKKVDAGFEEDGFGWFVVRARDSGVFLGCAGLLRTPFDASFTPCVEVDWRFTRAAWGHGYATEAARAVIGWGFRTFGLGEIVAFTYEENSPSRRVMERLGMRRDVAGDFEHPRLEPGHVLRPHVLYRVSALEFACEPSVSPVPRVET